jgi:hypothetical protein
VKSPNNRSTALTVKVYLAILNTKFLTNAVAHLTSGLIGKSNTKNRLWGDPDIENEICHSFGQGMSFSSASTGQYEKRSIDVVDRFLLSFIKHDESISKTL